MIALAPSPQFYERQRRRYAECRHRAAVCMTDCEAMASRAVPRDEMLRLLRAYATASKMVDIYRAMAEATEVYMRPKTQEEFWPQSSGQIAAFYACPICEEPHKHRVRWRGYEPYADAREYAMRIYVESAIREQIHQFHPELVFDPERLSFR